MNPIEIHAQVVEYVKREIESCRLFEQQIGHDNPYRKPFLALEAVLEFHKPETNYKVTDGVTDCPECHDGTGWYGEYPCPTFLAIAKALGVEG